MYANKKIKIIRSAYGSNGRSSAYKIYSLIIIKPSKDLHSPSSTLCSPVSGGPSTLQIRRPFLFTLGRAPPRKLLLNPPFGCSSPLSHWRGSLLHHVSWTDPTSVLHAPLCISQSTQGDLSYKEQKKAPFSLTHLLSESVLIYWRPTTTSIIYYYHTKVKNGRPHSWVVWCQMCGLY